MSRHRQQRRRYYLWQLQRKIQYQYQLITLWLKEQAEDLPDIIQQIKNK